MSLFGIGSESKSSTTNTSTQTGAEGGSAVNTGSGSIVYQFPDAVAKFTDTLIGAAVGLAQGAQDTLGTVATREKTPLTEWLPLAAVGAAALVAIAYFFAGKK